MKSAIHLPGNFPYPSFTSPWGAGLGPEEGLRLPQKGAERRAPWIPWLETPEELPARLSYVREFSQEIVPDFKN